MFFVPNAILAFIPNPIISQNEAWFMSNTEKVHHLWRKIHEVIDKVNTYDEMFAELKEILTDFDNTVRTAVEEYIHDMYENGQLKEIVAEIIDEIAREYAEQFLTQASKSSDLDLTRLFRVMNNVGENNTIVTNPAQWTYPQGFTEFTHNGVHMCACAYKCSNHSNTRYDSNAKIVLYRLGSNYNAIASINLPVGHANSLAYEPNTGHLYIAHNYENPYNNSTEVLVRSVSRILVNDIINGVSTSFLTRTPNSAEFTTISTVECYDNKLYVGHRNKYCEFNFTNNYLGETKYLTGDNSLADVTHIQDMSINNKYIMLLSYLPSRLYLYDKETGKLMWTYNIPAKLNNGMYRTIEPEAIKLHDNGDIYLSSGGHPARKDFNAFDIFQVFKQNIYHNEIAQKNIQAADRIGRSVTIYINPFSTTPNPNGDEDNAFAYPQEAINFVTDYDEIERANIVVQNSLTGIPWYICCKKSIFIHPSSAINNNIYLGGFVIEGCNNLTIRGRTSSGYYMLITGIADYIEHEDTSDGYFDLQKNIIVCKHSTVFFSNLMFWLHGNVGDIRNAIQGRYCMVSYGGDNAMTDTEFKELYSSDLQSSAKLLNFKDSLVNARGKAPNDANIINPSKIQYET